MTMELVLTSITAFAATNIDDLFILSLFYGNKKFRHADIMAGQFLGIIALIAVSLVASLLGFIIDAAYIGLLGLIPIFLGLKAAWQRIKESDKPNKQDDVKLDGNMLTVAGVTFSNGGDNIGIYTPLFATLGWTNKMTMVAVFLLMTLVWCLTARYFTKHPYVAAVVHRYGHLITPIVLIMLGVYILYESETFALLAD